MAAAVFVPKGKFVTPSDSRVPWAFLHMHIQQSLSPFIWTSGNNALSHTHWQTFFMTSFMTTIHGVQSLIPTYLMCPLQTSCPCNPHKSRHCKQTLPDLWLFRFRIKSRQPLEGFVLHSLLVFKHHLSTWQWHYPTTADFGSPGFTSNVLLAGTIQHVALWPAHALYPKYFRHDAFYPKIVFKVITHPWNWQYIDKSATFCMIQALCLIWQSPLAKHHFWAT
jgi:hypothetical protein